jgi:hypothetical protein
MSGCEVRYGRSFSSDSEVRFLFWFTENESARVSAVLLFSHVSELTETDEWMELPITEKRPCLLEIRYIRMLSRARCWSIIYMALGTYDSAMLSVLADHCIECRALKGTWTMRMRHGC